MHTMDQCLSKISIKALHDLSQSVEVTYAQDGLHAVYMFLCMGQRVYTIQSWHSSERLQIRCVRDHKQDSHVKHMLQVKKNLPLLRRRWQLRTQSRFQMALRQTSGQKRYSTHCWSSHADIMSSNVADFVLLHAVSVRVSSNAS